MSEQDPLQQTEVSFDSEAQRLQDNLNIFRSRVTLLLNKHDAINESGTGLALFERRLAQEHEERSSVYQVMVYQFRSEESPDNSDYSKPNIKLVVNEGVIGPKGPQQIVSDLTADFEDDVQHMIDVFDITYPTFPPEEMTEDPANNDEDVQGIIPYGPLFDIQNGDIVITNNFKYHTEGIGLDPAEFGLEGEVIYPFGSYMNLQDSVDATRVALEILSMIEDVEPYFIKR